MSSSLKLRQINFRLCGSKTEPENDPDTPPHTIHTPRKKNPGKKAQN